MHRGDSELCISRQYGFYLQTLVLCNLHTPHSDGVSFIESNVDCYELCYEQEYVMHIRHFHLQCEITKVISCVQNS